VDTLADQLAVEHVVNEPQHKVNNILQTK
jgi:hypothetical protein